MKYFNPDRYKQLETALKSVGLNIVFMEKHGKKTVITVTRYGQLKRKHINIRGELT